MLPTGAVSDGELQKTVHVVWNSSTAKEVKDKGVRKAALMILADSWSQKLENNDISQASHEHKVIGDGAGSSSAGPTATQQQRSAQSLSYAEMSRDQLLNSVLAMVSGNRQWRHISFNSMLFL